MIGSNLVQSVVSRINALKASLAVAAGSLLVGWSQAGGGAVTRTVQGKLREGAVSVLDYGADNTGATSSDAAFTAAAATGKSIYVPDGDYLLGVSITLAAGQRVYGRRQTARIWKNANVPMFIIPTAASRAGLEMISIFGNYGGWGAIPGRPGAAAAFTDTTDNIQVGTVGVEGPYFWVFDDAESQYAGQHGLNWLDGPSPFIRGYIAYAAGWGIISTQTQVVGGTAIDTHHATIAHLEVTNNGKSTLTDGGGAYLRGSSHTAQNLKAFGNYGDGLAVNATNSKLAAMVEQNGVVNAAVTVWATAQAGITAGTFRRSGNNLYVATTAGTTGATAPVHTAGAVSDGGVTWQYRRGLNLRVETNTFDANKVDLLWVDGVWDSAGNNDVELMAQPVAGSVLARTRQVFRSLFLGRASDFQKVGGGGAYETLAMQPRAGGGNGEWEVVGNNGASTVHDLYVGNAAGLPLRLRGAGVGSIQDIPVGARVKKITANFSFFGQQTGVADLILADCTAGAITVTLDAGQDTLPGRRVMIVKTDATANVVTVTGAGFYSGTAFGSFTLAARWAFTELFLMDTAGPNWWKKT